MARKNNLPVSKQAIIIFLIFVSTFNGVNSFDVSSFLSLLNDTKPGTSINAQTPFFIESDQADDSNGEKKGHVPKGGFSSRFSGIHDLAKALYDLRVINFSVTIVHSPEHQPTDDGAYSILAVTVITIASTIIYTVTLNPLKMIHSFAKAGRLRFILYISFIVMAFVSLVLGFFLLLISTKRTENEQLVRMMKEVLAQASIASIILCMAVGLCAVLPKLASIVVGVICVLAACFGSAALGFESGGNKNSQILDRP